MVKAFDLFELCTPVPESGCWIWLRAWNPDGYGKFTTKVNGEIYQCRAHRFIYESPSKLAKKYGVSYETIRVTKLGQNSKVRYLTEKESGAS